MIVAAGARRAVRVSVATVAEEGGRLRCKLGSSIPSALPVTRRLNTALPLMSRRVDHIRGSYNAVNTTHVGITRACQYTTTTEDQETLTTDDPASQLQAATSLAATLELTPTERSRIGLHDGDLKLLVAPGGSEYQWCNVVTYFLSSLGLRPTQLKYHLLRRPEILLNFTPEKIEIHRQLAEHVPKQRFQKAQNLAGHLLEAESATEMMDVLKLLGDHFGKLSPRFRREVVYTLWGKNRFLNAWAEPVSKNSAASVLQILKHRGLKKTVIYRLVGRYPHILRRPERLKDTLQTLDGMTDVTFTNSLLLVEPKVVTVDPSQLSERWKELVEATDEEIARGILQGRYTRYLDEDVKIIQDMFADFKATHDRVFGELGGDADEVLRLYLRYRRPDVVWNAHIIEPIVKLLQSFGLSLECVYGIFLHKRQLFQTSAELLSRNYDKYLEYGFSPEQFTSMLKFSPLLPVFDLTTMPKLLYLEKLHDGDVDMVKHAVASDSWILGVSLDNRIIPRHLYLLSKGLSTEKLAQYTTRWHGEDERFIGHCIKGFYYPSKMASDDVSEDDLKEFIGTRIEWNDQKEKAWENARADIVLDPSEVPTMEEYKRFRNAVKNILGKEDW
eukprot:GFYU01010707.1.p1 GENE.GFYU01010707.1~~GFYU01010707.1.p1  ORF type:complete len:635 (-),score=47.49 GFYU01010707.1:130-1974(-)